MAPNIMFYAKAIGVVGYVCIKIKWYICNTNLVLMFIQ